MNIQVICMVASVILSLCTFISGAVAFIIIRFNDFAHIEKNFDKSQEKVEKFENKITKKLDEILEIGNQNKEDIAVINERCKAHKPIKRKKK